MKQYEIKYSFIGPNGLTISGEMTVWAGDQMQARDKVVKHLREKYAWPVRMKDTYWNKPTIN